MKLTKTQTKLLLEAARRTGQIATLRWVGRGGYGAIVTGGGRDGDAAQGLRDKGLLVFVRHEQDRTIRNGYHTVCTTSIWQITERGRQVAQEQGALK